MFVRLNSNITLGKFNFDFVHRMTITSTWTEMTDTCVIQIPSKLKLDSNKLNTELKKGDAALVKIGYVPNLNTVFSGFVSRVKPTVPIEIEVQDLMWKLKQLQVNESVQKGEKLSSFLSRALPGIEIDCFDFTMSALVAHRITAAQLLNAIKEQYGFAVFIRNNKVVVGKQYDRQNAKRHIIELKNNNIDSGSLEYVSKDDLTFKVTAISNLESGKKIEVSVGDEGGEERTMNFYDLDKDQLKVIAEKEFEKLKYDGWRGDITIFGEPFVEHGDIVELRDPEGSDKQGLYFVDTVVTDYGIEGNHQTLTLGMKF